MNRSDFFKRAPSSGAGIKLLLLSDKFEIAYR